MNMKQKYQDWSDKVREIERLEERLDGAADTVSMKMIMVLCTILLAVLLMVICTIASADEINVTKLADAIYQAEGGKNTRHPYGILAKYKHTTPRQACINTINSNLKRFRAQTSEKDFIRFMGKTYCPLNAKNDPTGLNVNWEKNVKYFYNRRA